MRVVHPLQYREDRDAISHDWIELVQRCGCLPILLPNGIDDPAGYFVFQRCSALVLTNGDDVKLTRTPTGKFGGTERDILEAKLLSYAIKNKISVLGVCRGMQFINVYFGGKLTPRISGHVAKSHPLKLISQEYQNFYEAKTIRTNSYHKMGIRIEDLAADLVPWATRDNIVEAFSHSVYPILAIQWHPERKGISAKKDQRLIEAFLNRKSIFHR